ncbi:MAG: hypothetical protein JO170_22150 [Verrucomicrobia bacterium]|nr:hypothetical protein [Verrucomicrobiota bacterium]
MKQINVDGSRLQGVDLSQVPNQKIKMPKAAPRQLNVVESAFTRASISAAATVSNAGKWAAIPQDFGSGSLTATMVVPSSTPTPGRSTGGPLAIRPTTVAVTLGITVVVPIGVNMDGGAYWESIPNNFGLLGALAFAGSTSLGASGAIDVMMVDGPISLLDGLGITIIVDVGVSKTLFIGMGILVVLPSWKIVGYVMEFGGGSSIGPPITLNVQLGYGGHIQLL